MQKLSDERGLDASSVDPRVTIQVPTAAEIHLVVRFPVRASQRSYIEQLILSEVFTEDFSGKGKSTEEEAEEEAEEKA